MNQQHTNTANTSYGMMQPPLDHTHNDQEIKSLTDAFDYNSHPDEEEEQDDHTSLVVQLKKPSPQAIQEQTKHKNMGSGEAVDNDEDRVANEIDSFLIEDDDI